jgi:hypothetical protein
MSVFCECCLLLGKEFFTVGQSLVHRSVTECDVSEISLNTSTMRKPDLRTHDIKPAVYFHEVTSGLLTKC